MKNKNSKSSTGRLSWMLSGVLKSKRAEGYVDTAVKVLIAVVIGALLLFGLYGLVGNVVVPTTSAKVNSMFNYVAPMRSDGVAIGEGGTHAMDFADGPCTYQYYSTLERAMEDANAHTTANADADLSNAVAVIAERESDGMYIVKPLVPVAVTTPIEIKGEYVFDANGQTVSLAGGAHFALMTGANITLRDSGDGCIIKDTNLDAAQYVIFEETGQTRYNLTVLNGEYLIKNKGNAVVIAGRSEASTITVKGGFFKAISDEKMAIGIITMKLGNASFENCTLQGYSNAPMPLGAANSSNAGQAGMGGGMLLQSVSGKIRIKGGTFFGYSVCNRAYGIGITNVSTMIGKGEVEIDNGEFYGTTKTYSHASVEGCHIQNTKSSIIKGGKFSATGTGLNMKTTEQSTIIGGYFEGSEKGVWIGRGKCLLKNATAKEASATSLAVNQYAETDNVATSYTIKADLMIGYSGYDVEAYVDNCSLSGTIDNVTVQNQNSGSTKTSAKLYISNTACNKIFIIDKGGNDGENMVFVGKNVSYNGYEGSNLIDTTTYANQVFCEDI